MAKLHMKMLLNLLSNQDEYDINILLHYLVLMNNASDHACNNVDKAIQMYVKIEEIVFTVVDPTMYNGSIDTRNCNYPEADAYDSSYASNVLSMASNL